MQAGVGQHAGAALARCWKGERGPGSCASLCQETLDQMIPVAPSNPGFDDSTITPPGPAPGNEGTSTSWGRTRVQQMLPRDAGRAGGSAAMRRNQHLMGPALLPSEKQQAVDSPAGLPLLPASKITQPHVFAYKLTNQGTMR